MKYYYRQLLSVDWVSDGELKYLTFYRGGKLHPHCFQLIAKEGKGIVIQQHVPILRFLDRLYDFWIGECGVVALAGIGELRGVREPSHHRMKETDRGIEVFCDSKKSDCLRKYFLISRGSTQCVERQGRVHLGGLEVQ